VSRIVCAGAAGIDRLYQAADTLQAATSNPAVLSVRHGGVARNVAETLARLGNEVTLLSVVGKDPEGADLIAGLERAGVETRYISRSPHHRTGEYAAILSPGGELELGAADISILDAFGDAEIGGAHEAFATADFIFAECNLPAAALRALLGIAFAVGSPFAIDAVSVAKARRLPQELGGVALLFANSAEASALAGLPAHTMPEETSKALRERGADAVVIGLGSHGTLVRDDSGVRRLDAVAPKTIVDVTGAGDALIAGTIAASARGAQLDDAVRSGMLLASLTVECEGSVRQDLDSALVETERARSTTAAR
jgi:pseudouridine kinase